MTNTLKLNSDNGSIMLLFSQQYALIGVSLLYWEAGLFRQAQAHGKFKKHVSPSTSKMNWLQENGVVEHSRKGITI